MNGKACTLRFEYLHIDKLGSNVEKLTKSKNIKQPDHLNFVLILKSYHNLINLIK